MILETLVTHTHAYTRLWGRILNKVEKAQNVKAQNINSILKLTTIYERTV